MARRFPSKSRRETTCSSANTAARKSNWRARIIGSSTVMTSSPSSNNQLSTINELHYGGKTIALRRGGASEPAQGCLQTGQSRRGDAWPQRSQRRARQEIWLADGDQRRCHCRQGNRIERPVRKYGCPDGPRSRQQDQRRRRR